MVIIYENDLIDTGIILATVRMQARVNTAKLALRQSF